MNTTQLPYILEIAFTGSLSDAAKNLGITQPALSKYINELEKEVGMTLFIRSGRRLKPTPAGELYLETARQILDLIASTRTTIQLAEYPAATELHIGISPHRGAKAAAAIYPEFNRLCSDVRMIPHDGYAMSLKQMVLEGTIDIALTSNPDLTGSLLKTIPLHQEEIILAVPVFHRLAKKTGIFQLDKLPVVNLADFRDAFFILPEPPSALYTSIQPLFKRAGFHPAAAIRTPNIIMEDSLIHAGSGVGLLPSFYMRPNDTVAYYRLQHPAFLETAFLVSREHIFTRADRCFIYLMMKHILSPEQFESIKQPFLHGIIQEFSGTRMSQKDIL